MSLTDYYAAPVNALPGDPASFTVSLLCIITSQGVASATRRPYSQRGSTNPGWCFETTTTNAAMRFSIGGTNSINSPTSSIAAGDVGKIALYTGVWDAPASAARLFAKRLQVGTGTTPLTGGYAPDTAARPMIGRAESGNASDGIAVLGLYYALGVATLAQVQAQYDAVMATERIAICPGLPGTLVDLTADVLGNSGALPAALVDRGTGSVTFTRTGTPALVSQYARAWSW